MRTKTVSWLVAGALLFTGTAWAAEESLTLPEAVRTALERHPALQAAGYQVEAATSGVDLARSGFLPHVDFSESMTRGDNPVYAFGSLLNQGRFTQADFAVDRLNHPDPISNWRTNLSASLPLFTGGRTLLGFQQARIGLDAARSGRERVEQEAIFNVVRAYSALLLSQEAKETLDASVRTAEANLSAAETRVEVGVTVESDAIAARVRLARLREEAIAAANHIQLARDSLNDAMGLPLSTSRQVAGRLALPPVRQDRLDGLDTQALTTRPDYRQAELEEQRLEKELLRAKGALLPTLHLQGNYEINTHRFSSEGQDAWTVGMVVNWNLFNGGADAARMAEARANRLRAAALRERLVNTIGLEVREAYLSLQSARERVEVARGAVGQAAEGLRIVQDRYDSGLTTIVELLDSEAALSAARTSLTRNLYDATVAQARLDLSLGTLTPARF